MNAFDLTLVTAAAVFLLVWFLVDGIRWPECRSCHEIAVHPIHGRCRYARCTTIHHSYNPPTWPVDLAAWAFVVAGVARLLFVGAL